MKSKKVLKSVLSSILMTAIVCWSTSLSASAAVTGNSIESISQNEAQQIARELIQEGGAKDLIPDWNWNETTKIVDFAPMYDYNQNVNSYLFRLSTNNLSQGYIIVNAVKGAEGVENYCDTGSSPVDIMAQKALGHKIKADDKIVRAGMMEFAVQRKSGFLNLETDKLLHSTKQKLSDFYNSLLKKKAAAKSQSQTALLASASKNHSISNLNKWAHTYTAGSNGSFGEDNNCGPTALTNFIYYWSKISPNCKSGLWSGQVYQDLKRSLWYNSLGGSPFFRTVPALTEFGNSRSIPIMGSDERTTGNIDWAFITRNLNHNLPLIIGMEGDPTYGDHFIVGVGYKTSTLQIQSVDGWSGDTHALYTYNNAAYLKRVAYVRW